MKITMKNIKEKTPHLRNNTKNISEQVAGWADGWCQCYKKAVLINASRSCMLHLALKILLRKRKKMLIFTQQEKFCKLSQSYHYYDVGKKYWSSVSDLKAVIIKKAKPF